MKRLVVCCDGTWNNPEQEDNGIPSPTNVFKIFNAISDVGGNAGTNQIKYYHAGVGGEGGLVRTVAGGSVGAGISRHICEAYHWLGTHYEEGDEIYLFGFSRGAFTARSLGGFLGRGLLDLRNLPAAISYARVITGYQDGYRIKDAKQSSWAGDWKFYHQHDGKKDQPVPIHFIGVWDTVGSLGVPDDLEIFNFFDNKDAWQFHDLKLGGHVKYARHAMALDEMRSCFTVTRWENADGKRIKEIWFPGVHSDVGGGYADCSLSDGALLWMMKESEEVGLRFRSNAQKSVTPNPLGTLHNSYKGLFAKLRSRPRNIDSMAGGNEAIFHSSALERQKVSPIASPPYHPTKLLAVGERFTVEVSARNHWNPTGLYFSEGHSFTFSANGVWHDSADPCDWKGTEDETRTFGDVIRGVLAHFGKAEPLLKNITKNSSVDVFGTKRAEAFKWFTMVGAITNDSGRGNGVKNDGSSVSHQYVDLPAHESDQLEIQKSGYFYCFANDAWSFYENNGGSIRLTVTRVA